MINSGEGVMLREIPLPDGVPGRLFRAPMPGRWDWPLRRAEEEIVDEMIDLVVCLAPMAEIQSYAPAYAREIEDEDLPWETWDMPIPDGGLPEDEDEFIELAQDLAEDLQEGMNVLIHCYAGIGRTGVMAACTLMALGQDYESALAVVDAAGAGPETYRQESFVERAAGSLRYMDDI
jgi:protein-tyrosine phosphatase